MNKRLIIAITLFVLTIAGKLMIDLRLYASQSVNHHLWGPAIVFVVLIVCSWLARFRSAPMWLFLYWAMFDSLYGLFIHQGVFYVGDTARLDILQRSYPVIVWIKYFGAIASTIYYILSQKKVSHVRN